METDATLSLFVLFLLVDPSHAGTPRYLSLGKCLGKHNYCQTKRGEKYGTAVGGVLTDEAVSMVKHNSGGGIEKKSW